MTTTATTTCATWCTGRHNAAHECETRTVTADWAVTVTTAGPCTHTGSMSVHADLDTVDQLDALIAHLHARRGQLAEAERIGPCPHHGHCPNEPTA